MKRSYLLLVFLTGIAILVYQCRSALDQKEYLQKVLNNLEQVKSAIYYSTVSGSMPGDTQKFMTYSRYTEEFFNPSDTLAGSSYFETQQDKTHKTSWIYDGKAFTYLLWDEKRISIDSVPRRHPTPFFNFTKSIIKYALDTNDSIITDLKDFGDSVKFSLFIPYKCIEFQGKPVAYHDPYVAAKKEFSRYDIWINKSNNLPYRYRRNMLHQTTWQTCKNVELNKKKIENFIVQEYLPKDFPVSIRGKQKIEKVDLTGHTAPDWSLKDLNNNPISLNDLRSKVLMIQFSGIGCGPCHMSIPFLKKLVSEYDNKDFDFVSIETWSDNVEAMKRYQKNNELNYKFLLSTEEVTKSYQVNGVPAFYILDKNRVIKRIIVGYDKETTDKEILDAIKELI
ncbi:MAG TPA: TlpA disulfide reductase family protein [Flavobacteriaceae bacterium]|nr:TlpA disulfide reductase family protein [Flavobacteriaceae bacterium]